MKHVTHLQARRALALNLGNKLKTARDLGLSRTKLYMLLSPRYRRNQLKERIVRYSRKLKAATAELAKINGQ